MLRADARVVHVILLGRAVAVAPSSLGAHFEPMCRVTLRRAVRAWGSRRMTWETVERDLFWYDFDPIFGDRLFCTWAGFRHRIEQWCLSAGMSVLHDIRVQHGLPDPDFAALKGVKWRPQQKDVFVKLLSYDGGVIVCPTGFGKSFLIAQLVRVYPTAHIVVTVPSVDVARSIYKGIVAAGVIKDVAFCGDGKHRVDRVTVAVTQSLDYVHAEHVQLLLVDECHTVLTEHRLQKLHRFRKAKVFGFTATPSGKFDGSDQYLEAFFGPVIHSVGYDDVVATGNVVPIKVWWVKSACGPDLDGVEDPLLIEKHGIIANHARNRLIAGAAKHAEREFGSHAQILIMVDKIEHAFRLKALLPDYQVVTGDMSRERAEELKRMGVAVVDSDVERAEAMDKFASREWTKVISTRVWDKGVNFPDLQVLIRADGLASPIAATQIPGRLSRHGASIEKPYGVVIDFNDTFCRQLRRRSMLRAKVYRSHGWDAETIDVLPIDDAVVEEKVHGAGDCRSL